MKYISVLFLILFTACNVIIIEDISDKAPKLLSPANGATVNKLRVQFMWDEVNGADAYHFQIIENSFDNSATVLHQDTLHATSYEYVFASEGAYQWRVSGVNDNYTTQYSVANLTVEQ